MRVSTRRHRSASEKTKRPRPRGGHIMTQQRTSDQNTNSLSQLIAAGSTSIQKKLKVGKPNDKYEKEADKTAEKAVSSPAPDIQTQDEKREESVQAQPQSFTVQMQGEEKKEEGVQTKSLLQMQEEEKKEPAQTKPIEPSIQAKEEEKKEGVQAKTLVQKQEEKKEEAVQTKDQSSRSAGAGFQSQLNSRKGSGEMLPTKTRSFMESYFGRDFSHIQVHKDQDAVQMSKQLGAQAFTHGKDIYFNEGKYHPHSTQGKRLIAHELTHVVQQNASSKKGQHQSSKNRASRSKQNTP